MNEDKPMTSIVNQAVAGKTTGKHPGGRPTKYNAEFYPKLAFYMGKSGMIDREIAEELGVCEKTLNIWKKKHPEFLQSIKRGKIIADAKVAYALYRRAIGYEHTETKVFCHKGRIITHEITKHYPPDYRSIIFWLKNRQPDLWRDKQEVKKSGGNIIIVRSDKEDAGLVGE